MLRSMALAIRIYLTQCQINFIAFVALSVWPQYSSIPGYVNYMR